MSNNSPTQKCQKCGQPRVRQGKFCIICGTRFTETEPRFEIDEETEDSEALNDTAPIDTEDSSQVETSLPAKKSLISFEKGVDLLKYLRENLAVVLISTGAISIIGAIAFTVIMLLPEEIISGVEVPPIEGMIFDLFVIIGLLAILIKEGAVFLGYLHKKGTLDRWFSFVLLLVYWINLITFSLGLVQKSIFIDLGVSFPLIFIVLSLCNFIPSIVYFRRFKENIFSGILIINLVSVLYLLQWISPVDPILFTIAVYFLIILVILAVFLFKDPIPFIGLNFLLPIVFLSPYLLSNSVVIFVLLVLNVFPFIEILLRNYLNRERNLSNSVQTIGQLISPLGIITTSFAVFYGYLEAYISLALFAVPVIGFIVLKSFKPVFKRSQSANFVLIIFLIFATVLLDLSIGNSPVVLGVAFLLTIQTLAVVLGVDQTKQQSVFSNLSLLIILSLIVISLTKIDFVWKIVLIIVPIVVLCYLLLRKLPVDHNHVQIIVFGVEAFFLVSFVRTPSMDWMILPISLVLALLGLTTLVFFHRNEPSQEYSRDITIFVMVFEAVLLVIMLWTQSSIEMLYPVMILIVFAGMVLLVEGLRSITSEFQWINASFLVCFGLMTFWNEFDEMIVLIVTFLLILPIMVDLFKSKGMDKSSSSTTTHKIFNLNISLSGIGLSLIIFFEELSPINHGLIYLIVVITWLGMYFSARNSLGNQSVLTILTLPGIIFFFEMLLHETIFTPITEINYLYITSIILLLQIALLQFDKSFLKKETSAIIITPFVIGTAVFTLLSVIAFLIYDFTQLESYILIIGISIGIIVSTIFIEWQYESGLLILISSIPPLFYLTYLEALSYAFYLLPLMPIIVNFLIGFRYFKTSLSIRLQEFIIALYLILFVVLNPIQILVYSTALVSLYLVSWQILGLIKQKQHKATFILTNTVNAGLVLGLTLLLDPLPQDLFVLEITVSLILALGCLIIVFTSVSTVLHLLYWQFKEIDRNFSVFMTITLIFDSSAVIMALIALLSRYTDLKLDDILVFILISTIVLVLLFVLVYTKGFIIKSQISAGCLYVTTIWLILSSAYSPNIETVFLWMFFAPILMIVFLAKRDKSIGIIGLILYLVAGMQLLTHTLDFILLGDTEWVTILGLIIYGIEMVTLGIYASMTRKNSQETVIIDQL